MCGKRQINALFCINTPAQAYAWQHVVENLIRKGHKVRILARDYGSTAEILESVGLHAYTFRPIKKNYLRLFDIIVHLYNGLKVSSGFSPTIIIGFGVDAAFTAGLLRKPCIVFTDSEPMPVQRFFIKLLASAIVTPRCFKKDLGKKHVRIEGYKELAYLHPNYFEPDPSIFKELGLAKDEKYVILRFNVFDAVHDIGRHGFPISDQFRLVNELRKYAHMFISPEGSLPAELEVYRLPITYERIHHALYYSQLLVTDTQTMTTEAAVLGTPAVRCNNFVGSNDMGNFSELEQKYDLIYSFRDSEQAIRKATELIKQPELKKQWAGKRQKLIEDKIDVTQFLVDFITNYPESLLKYKGRNNIRG
jgi:predicted glycosyltransferase